MRNWLMGGINTVTESLNREEIAGQLLLSAAAVQLRLVSKLGSVLDSDLVCAALL